MMRSDETKILDELRRFPALRLSQETKQRMLNRLREEQQKRYRVRRVKAWATGLAACAVLLVMVWQGAEFLKPAADPRASTGETRQPPAETSWVKPRWQTMDTSQFYEGEYKGEARGAAMYLDPTYKKLYLAKDGQVALLYETREHTLSIPHVYPHPNQPDRYYVWFSEENDMTAVHHLMVVEGDGSHVEVANLPQPGHGSYRLEWSPSGNTAFYLAETADLHEGAIGIIDNESLRFQPLYGGIETPAKNVESVVGMIRQWLAAWVDNTTILLYNGGFFLLDAATQQVQPLAMELPASLRELTPLKLTKVKASTRYLVLLFGQKKYDFWFYGKDRVAIVDLKEGKLLLPAFEGMADREYEQMYLGAGEGGRLLIGEIAALGQQEYELRIGEFDPESGTYNKMLTMPYDRMVQIWSQAISADGRYLALMVAFPEQGGQNLCVLDLAKRLAAKVESADPLGDPSLTWLDQDTLKAGSVIYELE